MVVHNILYMNKGDGETSYANNSNFQKNLLLKARPLVEDAIKDMFTSGMISTCFKLADLGCSSGPNTFMAISGIINTVHELCQQANCESPEFQVFLNDLPENDFNTIFKLTPSFYEEIKKEKGDKLGTRVFITGVPGSFYGRLFPSKSLDFVHSTTSLHWLSQVPNGLENNKGCIYVSKRSPPEVLTSYANQFQRDFTVFLSARAKEVVTGGHMAVELFSRSSADPTCKDSYYHWQLLADSLLDMAAEGLVKETDIDSFNIPYYAPFKDEVRTVVQEEGSFNFERLETVEVNVGNTVSDKIDKNLKMDKSKMGQMMTDSLRAVVEPMLTSHFGSAIIDDLFVRLGKRMVERVTVEKNSLFGIADKSTIDWKNHQTTMLTIDLPDR